MILKKEFYFVRHGQTDHNVSEGNLKGDHPHDISLNETGKSQARAIEPLIATLPIQTICSSPLRRVQETKEIIASKLLVNFYDIENLGECTAEIWKEMSKWGMYNSLPESGKARDFMNRVLDGVNQALSLPGPLLIVAHGGVHWAICCLMGIKNHNWAIQNCGVVHFSMQENGIWSAKLL